MGVSQLIKSDINLNRIKSKSYGKNDNISNKINISNRVNNKIIWVDKLCFINIKSSIDSIDTKNKYDNENYDIRLNISNGMNDKIP